MARRRLLLAVVASVALGASFAVGFEWRARSAAPSPVPRRPAAETLRGQVVDDLAALYYARVPARALRAKSLAGLLAGLHDPYTTYLPPEVYRSVIASEDGGYSGVGLALENSQHGLVVTRVMPGMPGGQAGIRPGDVITSVNGSSVAALSFMHALNLIARGAGGQVHLVVLRRGGGGPVRVTLVPRLIPVPVVTATALTYDGRRYEYVRMFSFPNGSAVAVQRAVALAVRNHARGVVLDLRGNPGGLLAQAVAVARLFVGSGPIVTTYGLHEPRQVLSGDGTAVHGLRVAVMVDHATASAAEVVAGSLRHAGAVLVGRRTYGKGTVQSIEPLSNGGGLKLTVARFVLPGDVVIEGRGLRPDVTVRGASRRKWATLLAALRELAG